MLRIFWLTIHALLHVNKIENKIGNELEKNFTLYLPLEKYEPVLIYLLIFSCFVMGDLFRQKNSYFRCYSNIYPTVVSIYD
jgi:hypothetical protein